jgi:transposase-like protein
MSDGVSQAGGMKTQLRADESVLTELVEAYADQTKARELLESRRWPNGPVCPHCKNAGDKRISQLEAQTAGKRGVRQGVYFCGACRRQFTVTVGTVLERSHVPISKWVMALSLLCSSKKSLSANQVHRMIGVTYKTVWFMCHRIRLAMTPHPWAEAKLKGTVEVDETFVGPRAKRKTPVVALVERQGLARVKVIASVTQKNLGGALSECVSQEAVVHTDEHRGYKNPLKHWKEHQAVNHSRGDY